MLFGLFGKKKDVKKDAKVPRVWKFPAGKAKMLLERRKEYQSNSGGTLELFMYYLALSEAGFDGFGHGRWKFRMDSRSIHGVSTFPYPCLVEKVEDENT